MVPTPKTNYLAITFVFLFFTIFMTGVYYLGRQSVTVVPANTINPINVSPTSSAILKSYTDETLGISIQFPSKYTQSYNQQSNYYALELLGPDYGTQGSDMGVRRTGTFFIISENNSCTPSSHVSLDTLLEANSQYSLYKIKGVEGPDYKVALFKKKDNKCIDITCNSDDMCDGEVYSDFDQILSTLKFINQNGFEVVSTNPIFDLSKVDNIYQGDLNNISITFNQDVDQSTLIEKNIGVLWGVQDYVPSQIKYDSNTKTATIFFNKPIKAVVPPERLTFVIDGVKDTSGNFVKKISFNIDITLD